MKKALFWLIAVAVIAVTYYVGIVRMRKVEIAEEKPVPVQVAPVEKSDIESIINTTGAIEANMVVRLSPKVGGRLELLAVERNGVKIPVEEGLTVEAGETVAIIDHDLYEAELRRAQAAVAAAQASLRAAEIELTDATRDNQRIASLFESGSTTEQARDRAATVAELAQARLAASQAQLLQAQAVESLAGINLQESTLVSPIRGVVVARHIDQGNLISPGQPILTIADMETVKVIVTVADRHEGQLRENVPVRLSVDGYPGEVFEATVHSVYPSLHEQTRSLKAEIRYNNSDMKLRAGMFARVAMVTQRREAVVVVQRDVLLGLRLNEPYVYVVNNEKAHRRAVVTGVRQGDQVEIVSGLDQGDSLVITGMTYLKDGVSVRTVRLEDIQ